MKTIAVTMEESILESIDRLARRPGKRSNRSAVVRQAVREFLSRIAREAEEERERLIYRRHRAQLRRDAIALIRKQAKV